MLGPQQVARLVMETVGRFCRSADPAPAGHHVPRKPGLDDPGALALLRRALPPLARAKLTLDRTGLAWIDHYAHPGG